MAARAKKQSTDKEVQIRTRIKPATEKDVPFRSFKGHTGEVVRVAMPTNGRFALTSSLDGTVRKWILDDSKVDSEIICRSNRFCGLALTADGGLAAAGDSGGTIYVINILSGQVIQKWQGQRRGMVDNLAFTSDGGQLLSLADNRYLRQWDVKTERSISKLSLSNSGRGGFAVSLNGKMVACADGGGNLAIWSDRVPKRLNGVDGEPVTLADLIAQRLDDDDPIDRYHRSLVGISASGQFAFVGSLYGKVAQWDLVEGRKVASFEGHSGSVLAIAVTPDGRFCISGGEDKSVRLWAAETGECLAILRGHVAWINCVAVTPDARRICSVSYDGTLRVWDIPEQILARAATSKKRGYVNAKVVLLGDSGVGKSGLALRLWHDRWEKTESSHGMEIQRLELQAGAGDDGVEREVWLWDLAGQPDYRLTHQLFMEQTSLALLVFDPQEGNLFETVGYWQNALRKVARSDQMAGILVAARCDRPGLRLTLDEVSRWAVLRGLHGPILTAAKLKTHAGIAELRDLIAKLLPWDKMEFRSTMENFPPLKDAILELRDKIGRGGVVVTPSELESRVRETAPRLEFIDEDLRAVTGLLAGEGVLHKLPYGDLVVLQPSWVNCYASTLVKLAGEAESQLGHVPLASIQPGKLPEDGTPRLSLEDERQLLPALVALFLERALAWKQSTDKGEMLIFPNYVRLPRPEPPPRPGRTVLYRFSGPLEEIYCTLVVRLHYSGLFANTKLYRQGVDFETATGKLAALTMKEEGERGELEIYFGAGLDADVQAPFQRFVHSHLQAKASDLERLRNFFCPKCMEEVTDRKVIDAALARKRNKILCAYCDPDDPGMIALIDVLERQFASKAGETGANLAGRKAGEEISTASMEQVMVGEVMTLVASVNQAFIPRVVRDEGTDGEIEFFAKSGKSTGLVIRVQLKSGDSHLKKLKNGTEKFPMKNHYERYWAGPGTVPVLLIIRTSDRRLRYINATDAIRAEQRSKPGRPVKQIVFKGEEFSPESILSLRDKLIKK
jgi:WD40 repeat protein